MLLRGTCQRAIVSVSFKSFYCRHRLLVLEFLLLLPRRSAPSSGKAWTTCWRRFCCRRRWRSCPPTPKRPPLAQSSRCTKHRRLLRLLVETCAIRKHVLESSCPLDLSGALMLRKQKFAVFEIWFFFCAPGAPGPSARAGRHAAGAGRHAAHRRHGRRVCILRQGELLLIFEPA